MNVPIGEESVPNEVFTLKDVSVYYGSNLAVQNVNLPVYENQITALIGPRDVASPPFSEALTV